MTEAQRRTRLRHGLYTLKKAVAVLGSRALPSARTALGRELRAWRAALVRDLGGEEAISTQQRVLLEKVVTQKLLTDSLDAYVLGLGSLVNKRSRALWPIVRERTAQVALLQSLLRDLGLERRAREVPDLQTYLARKATPAAAEPPPAHPAPPAGDAVPAPSATAHAHDDPPQHPARTVRTVRTVHPCDIPTDCGERLSEATVRPPSATARAHDDP